MLLTRFCMLLENDSAWPHPRAAVPACGGVCGERTIPSKRSGFVIIFRADFVGESLLSRSPSSDPTAEACLLSGLSTLSATAIVMHSAPARQV